MLSEKELKDFVLLGKNPLKAIIVWKIVRFFKLLSMEKKKIPFLLKWSYKLVKNLLNPKTFK